MSALGQLKTILRQSSEWSDVKTAIAKHSLGGQTVLAGHLFEEFCRFLIKTHPKYTIDYKDAWIGTRAPTKVKQALDITDDYGVDLAIANRTGGYSAGQCKFVSNEDEVISWSGKKISHVFSDAPDAEQWLVITNAKKVDRHAQRKKKYRNRVKTITYNDLIVLGRDDFDRICRAIDNKKPKPISRFQPEKHQKDAIKSVIEGFKGSPRGKMIMPCGAGKTVTSLWIREKTASKRTLVLVPSLALLRQFKEDWVSQISTPIEYICVCSETNIDTKTDEEQVQIQEITGTVTTEPREIRDFLLKRRGDRVIFSTYQSLAVISKALNGTNLTFDLCFCDEAHRTATGISGSLFSLIHDDRKVPVKKRLYMTATPRIIGNKVKEEYGENVYEAIASMDKKSIFGPNFYEMTFGRAIKDGLLARYQIVGIGCKEPRRSKVVLRRFIDEGGLSFENYAQAIGLKKALVNHKVKHLFSFHGSVRGARDFAILAKQVADDPNMYFGHVEGKMPTSTRKNKLNDFIRSEKGLMSNARCLTEGVDAPIVDGIFFCDPKYSKIDIVQAIGRALRKPRDGKKKTSFIIVPIFHETRKLAASRLDEGPYEQLGFVLRSLASYDESLMEELRKIKLGLGKPAKRHLKTVVEHDKLNLVLEGMDRRLTCDIFTHIVKSVNIPWREFKSAREFVQKLELKNSDEFKAWSKTSARPADIPLAPQLVYEHKGWNGMDDFLGTGRLARGSKMRSFTDARKFVHTLQLKGQQDWYSYCRGGKKKLDPLPPDIPKAPWFYYKKKGWISLTNWLGKEERGSWRSFTKARSFVHDLGLKNNHEWRKYTRGELKGLPNLPSDIPKTPEKRYLGEFKNWGDWLGVRNLRGPFRNYKDAKAFMVSTHIETETNYRKFVKGEYLQLGKLPYDIPTNPDRIYKGKGWKGWADYLRDGKPIKRKKK